MYEQLDVFGGSTPLAASQRPGVDPTRLAREGRKQANRDRLQGTGPSAATWLREFGSLDDEGEMIDPHTSDMFDDHGIRVVTGHAMEDRRNRIAYGPHDSPVFRKAGVQAEVPLYGPDAITTMQDTVAPERVQELRNPAAGSDPRFPGRERPLAVELKIPPREGYGGPTEKGHRALSGQVPGAVDTPVLWNGNHRVAAAIERGEMFTPVQLVRQEDRVDAAVTHSNDERRFKQSRAAKYNLAAARLATGDATRTEPLRVPDLYSAIEARRLRDQ